MTCSTLLSQLKFKTLLTQTSGSFLGPNSDFRGKGQQDSHVNPARASCATLLANFLANAARQNQLTKHASGVKRV